ncbi:MAG: hypothetical protein AAGC67_12710 [Myxococcota bacterium]
MPPRSDAAQQSSEFVQLLREFLTASSELAAVFDGEDGLDFASLARVVGDDPAASLFRLKERSHALFRTEGLTSEAVRREVLFDLTVGALFHAAMKLRESLYQREVYAPRLASLRAATDGDPDALFSEFEGLLERSAGRVDEGISEVRILLAQTREQFHRMLVERADERGVVRCLLRRREFVDATFRGGFTALLEEMYGSVSAGFVEAARALLHSAYFVEASQVLREAAREMASPSPEIDQLDRYAEGMQAFLDGEYAASIAALEAWADLGGPEEGRRFARRAASALSRVGRLVENDAEGASIVDAAKQLQGRLESSAG